MTVQVQDKLQEIKPTNKTLEERREDRQVLKNLYKF